MPPVWETDGKSLTTNAKQNVHKNTKNNLRSSGFKIPVLQNGDIQSWKEAANHQGIHLVFKWNKH